MAQISKYWDEINQTLENFKKEFESKYGHTINLHLKVRKLTSTPNLSLQELLNELNIILLTDYPDGKIKASYGTVILSDGIKTKTRTSEVVILRHIFCYIANDLGYTSSSIGKVLGKDHCTVLHSLKVINNCIEMKIKPIVNQYERVMSHLVIKYGDKINEKQESNTGRSS